MVAFSAPGSDVYGILQARNWSRLPFPFPGDFPNPRIEPMSLHGRSFFTIFTHQVDKDFKRIALNCNEG